MIKIIIIIILSSIILLSSLLYFNSEDLVVDKNIDLLIKNNSWNTWFSKSIPYKKWDELEINIILKNWLSWIIELDKNILPINPDSWTINWKEIDINSKINIKKWESLKLKWKAKDNWILKNDLNIVKEILLKENIKNDENQEKIDKTIDKNNIKINFSNYNLNWNTNNLINIYWSWIENIAYINIWWISLYPIKDDKNNYYLSINKNTFSSWEYFIIVQLKDNSLITLNQKFKFNYSKDKVNIVNITPNYIKNDTDKYIVLQWNWFSKTISIQLSNYIILKNTSFNIINDKVLSVKIPSWLEIWKYFINIMTTDWIFEIKNNNFYITN